MKAILEFDLYDSDDKMLHLRCIKSTDLAIAFFEILHQKRKELYSKEELDGDTIDKVYDMIYDVLEDNNLSIDEIIM